MRYHKTLLGMNGRNVDYIYTHNQRKHYPLADNKLLSKKLLETHSFPTPRLLFEYNYFFELRNILTDLTGKSNFVIKPVKGKGGGGIKIIDKSSPNGWITSSGKIMKKGELIQHATDIISGVYSLDNSNDSILIEEKIELHTELERMTYLGIPDIRIIVFKNTPVMAMMRIPTKKSDGKANLHAGGVGIAIDIESGLTFINPTYRKCSEKHPDTEETLTGVEIPHWQEILTISRKIQNHVPLQYLGIDFVIDKRYGPQILELNVRPGLEIQNINGKGLRQILEKTGGMA